MKKITVIVPAHNESKNIAPLYKALSTVFDTIKAVDFQLLIIDDGSTDDTFKTVTRLAQQNSRIKGIKLSRNFGHQAALKAGLDNASGDAVIMMDADLQHPPELIPEMIAQWRAGYEMVGTIRQDDESVGFFKRFTSRIFYRCINFLSDVNIAHSAADFRLLDAQFVKAFSSISEQDLFIRGLVPWLGGKQVYLPFKVGQRNAGRSSYSLRKMLRLAVDGVVSFSTVPLRFAVYLGFLFSGLSLLYLPYIFYSYAKGIAVSGWASLLATVVFFGGLQLVVLGVIGIYLGKIFNQSKARPIYVISKRI